MIDNRITIKIKTLDGAEVPTYATEGSSGFDFVASEGVVLNPFTVTMVKTGVCVSIPPGFELQVRPRSGLSSKTKVRIANSPGTIDSDYRGEVMIIMENNSNVVHEVRKGDKIAQGVICPWFRAVWEKVDDLDETGRGDKGFGHSG